MIRKNYLSVLCLFMLLLGGAAQTRAFPETEGFARYVVTGGRSGAVYHVTNLNDSGSNGGKNVLIDLQTDCGGYIVYNPQPIPSDSNGDGIADEWAAKYMPAGASYQSTHESGYSYLELYINSLVDELMKKGCADTEDESVSANDFRLTGSPSSIKNENADIHYIKKAVI